ncbi:MAG: hypothetical protein ACPHUK_07510 [Candidatus Poseidoniaceae archaeon]
MSDEDKILGGPKWIPVYLVLFLILYLLVEGIDGLLSVGESFPGGQLFFFSCFGGVTVVGLVWWLLLKDYDLSDYTANRESKINSYCSSCGMPVEGSSGLKKAGKVAVYTPTSSYLAGTVGFALGGFPGLFLAGFLGGAWGYTTALNDKTLCEFCDE